MTTNYISSHGMVWGEMSSTGVVTSYGHDALGSVTETYQNGALQNTYRYKPYGGLLAKTGTAPDPSFLWNGGSGYRATNLPNSDYYVRRRHYSTTSAKWTTADPLWPDQLPFAYVGCNPSIDVDPSGLFGCRELSFSHSDNCPTYEVDWHVTWNVGVFTGPGLIVQHVVLSNLSTDCNNKFVTQSVSDYYEAWVIQATSAGLKCSGSCEDHYEVVIKKNSCASTNYSWTGEACFFPGATINSTWQQPCKSGPAGLLPCLSRPPSFWANRDTKNCVKRTLSYVMTCCGKENNCNATRTNDFVSLVPHGCGR